MKKLLLACMMALGIGASAQTTVTIGTGTLTTSGTNGTPIYRSSASSSYNYSQSVQLLTQSQLAAAGILPGATITKIAYYKENAETLSPGRTATINVFMKNSSLTTLTTSSNFATWTAGATNVYSNATYGSAATDLPAVAGWVEYNFSTPFQYTGGSLETAIDWRINAGTGNGSTGAFTWQYTSGPTQAVGTSSSTPITSNLTGSQSRYYNAQLTYSITPCSGAPAPGNTVSSTAPTCPGSYQTTLSAQNPTVGSGVTYQWFQNGTAVTGATASTLQVTVTQADTFYIAVTCGGVTVNSNPLTVTAPMTSLVPPYTNDFTTFPGSCWSQAGGGTPAAGPDASVTTNYWFAGGFLNVGTTGAAKINLYSTNRTGWLISPAFDLTAGGYRVKFDYGVTDYADTAPSAMGADDVVNFLVSTNGGTTWTVLETWDDANTPTNNLNQYIYIIPAGTSVNNVKFAFYGTDGSVDDTVDFEFFVDNFVIEAVPSCLEPTQFTVTGYTFNSVSLSWQAPTPAPANGYQVYYSTVNTAPTATTMLDATNSVTSTSTTASIGGLTASTTYYIWVRSDCGTSQSPWAAGGSFTTACAAIVPTYTNDFTTFPGLCWSYASGGDPSTGPTGTNQDFYADEFLNAIGGSNSAKINLWNAGTHAWLISPEFNLTGGDYIVSFDYGMTEYAATTAGTLGSDDVIQFLMSTDGGATWTVLNTWNSTTPISNTSTAYSYTVTGGTSSVMFAIYASEGTTDDTSDNDVFFDNFQVISTTLGTTDVIADKKSVKVYPNPFTDVLHISDIKDVVSVTVTDMSGRMVKTIAKPTAQLQLGDLKSGLYLVTLKYKDGSVKTVKAIKK